MITIDYINKCLSSVIDSHIQVSPNTKLADLGLDSLTFFTIIQSIEKDFDIEIKLSNVWNSLSIEELIRNINADIAGDDMHQPKDRV